MTTADSARTWSRSGSALGEDKLSYLGFSYGTFLGTVYAGMFPDRVRALRARRCARSGASAPRTGSSSRPSAFEKALDTLPRRLLERHQLRVQQRRQGRRGVRRADEADRREPLPALVERRQPAGRAGRSDDGVSSTRSTRARRGASSRRALALAQRGDGSILLLLSDAYNQRQPDGSYSNEFAAFFAVNCTDAIAADRPGRGRRVAAKLIPQAPRFGPAFAYGTLATRAPTGRSARRRTTARSRPPARRRSS